MHRPLMNISIEMLSFTSSVYAFEIVFCIDELIFNRFATPLIINGTHGYRYI